MGLQKTNKSQSEIIEKTELLTVNGWVPISEILPGDKVVSMDLNSGMSYTEICSVESEYVDKKMLRFHTGRVDITINPDGLIPICKYKSTMEKNDNCLTVAKHLSSYCGIQGGNLFWKGITPPSKFILPSCKSSQLTESEKASREIPIEKWLELYGLFMKKGSIYNAPKDGNECTSSFRVGFSHSNSYSEKDMDKTRELLKTCGFCPIKNHDKNQTISCYDANLATYFKSVEDKYELKLDCKYFMYPSKYLSILFCSYLGAANNFNLKRNFKTKSKRNAEIIQELILKSFGLIVQIKQTSDKKYYYMSLSRNKAAETIMLGKGEAIDYSGNIYKLKAENDILLIRQNSMIGWIGCGGTTNE